MSKGTDLRGVENGKKWSPAQLAAIELFAAGAHKCQEVAKEVGVNPTTISNWRKNYQFIDAILVRAREMLRERLPDLYNSGVNEACKGSSAHLKIILDHIEKLENIRSEVADHMITFKWEDNGNNP